MRGLRDPKSLAARIEENFKADVAFSTIIIIDYIYIQLHYSPGHRQQDYVIIKSEILFRRTHVQ
jgi:hypothetical protein